MLQVFYRRSPCITTTNYNVGNILSSWTPQTSRLYQIRLEVATTGSEIPIAYAPLYKISFNNIYPTGNIFPISGSTCGDFVVVVDMVGEFFVNAQYLAYWHIGSLTFLRALLLLLRKIRLRSKGKLPMKTDCYKENPNLNPIKFYKDATP